MRDTGREWAETCKLDGNKHFAQAEWEQAITFYEEGVAAVDSMMMNPADDVKVACYSNMAAAYLKLERYDEAFSACSHGLKYDEKHIKCLLRRAQAGMRGASCAKRAQIQDDLALVLSLDSTCKEAVSMKAAMQREDKGREAESISQQKRIFGGFWGGKGGSSAKQTLYHDVASEQEAAKRHDSICYLDIAMGPEGSAGGQVKGSGRVYLQLFSKLAPKHCENFRLLCTGEKRTDSAGVVLHYEGTQIHRVVKGFAIQGGDIVHREGPQVGTGLASVYGEPLNTDENAKGRHLFAGQLCGANRGKNTGGSQWYITLDEAPWLDGDFVVFGRVVAGMDFVRRIEVADVEDEDDHRPTGRVIVTACGECGEEERERVMKKEPERDPGPLWKHS